MRKTMFFLGGPEYIRKVILKKEREAKKTLKFAMKLLKENEQMTDTRNVMKINWFKVNCVLAVILFTVIGIAIAAVNMGL